MALLGDKGLGRLRNGIIIAGFAMPVLLGMPSAVMVGLDDTAVFLTLMLMQFPIMGVFNAIPYFVLSHMIGELGDRGSAGFAGRAFATAAYAASGVGFSLYMNVRVFLTPHPSDAKGYFVIPLVGVFCWMAIRALYAVVRTLSPAGKTDHGPGS